ncbi:MAG: hypothetical protein FJ225_10370 [Lentisphaerae bacterium]|nr:hypothetical protein [Lentisphaerota bacterium]
MARFETAVQSVISSLDQGWGRRLLAWFAAGVLLLALIAVYARSQFRGLREAEAMEYAQLGRGLLEGRGFATRCIRPADIAFAEGRGRAHRLDAFPDMRHGPLFPALLALAYRATGVSFEVKPSAAVHAPEALAVIPVCALGVLLAGLMTYLLARRLFDEQVAAVCALVYFVSRAALSQAVSGLPTALMSFLTACAAWALARSAEAAAAGRGAGRYLPGAALAGLLGGAAFLAGYGSLAAAAALAVFAALAFEERPWAAALAFAGGFAVAAAPWIARTVRETGLPLGLSTHAVFKASGLYAEDVMAQGLSRLDGLRAARLLRRDLLAGLPRAFETDLRSLGSGLVVCFFLVALFQSHERRLVGTLRGCVGLGAALTVLGMAAGWLPGRELGALLPLITVFGVGGFFEMLRRDPAAEPGRDRVLTWALVALSALGTVAALLGPRAGIPYPPYYPPLADAVCALIEPDEALCSDIPEATAWYGNRVSVLLPREAHTVAALEGRGMPIGGVYLTTRSASRPYVGALTAGPYSSWLPVLRGQAPPDFPFTEGIALPPGTRDQLFLTKPGRLTSPEPPPAAPPAPTPAPADRP